jgi:predicted enzyme related to lactoylglutathione lyase
MSRPVHFEIHASDPTRIVKFYEDVFGWNITHMPQFDYWLIDTGGGEPGINGGLMNRRGPAPGPDAAVNAFVCSIGIDSVDAYLDRAVQAGATVALPKMTIPGVGYQAYIKDPDGNILGLHQADRSATQ